MFAEKYLARNTISGRIKERPHSELGIAVVIPCFREPEITDTLLSLARCLMPEMCVEVIVLINHPETASDEIKAQSQHTLNEINEWISGTTNDRIRFFAVGPIELKRKWAGVGMARKAGMDEAVLRFNQLNNPAGIIVSLDADTLVDDNYLVEVEKYFRRNPLHAGATISFNHRKDGLDEKHLQGIVLYEKYMEYYKRAMGFTGYPYPMFTVGSAFTVTAGAYVRRGGMNRRQAGEDFYFLQNLVQVGTVGEITSTAVHPSARTSDRVPFGTGLAMRKWMKGEEDLHCAYSFEAYVALKQFFTRIDSLFQISRQEYDAVLSGLPQSVSEFLIADEFWLELYELNRNCAGIASFRLRFFHIFNAFKILKFLNFSHGRYYEKADLNYQLLLLKDAEQNSK
jgi:glycosyltransferase involved in cell wall biosynthesis